MKKGKVLSNPSSPSSRFAVLWVDCGAFLLWPGPNCGLSTPPNKPSPACCKPDHVLSVKKPSKNAWPCFYPGKSIRKFKWRATAGRAAPKRKTKSAEESSPEDGFSMVALCLLLPLIAVLISIFIAVSFWLKNFWAVQKICEETVLQAQRQMSVLVPSILKLNPEIAVLKSRRTVLRVQLVAAVAHGNLPLAAKLTAQLKIIEARLLVLLGEQNFILQQAQASRWRALAEFRHKTRAYGQEQSHSPIGYPLSLGLTPDQPADPPPIYRVPDDFLEKQRLEIQWKQKLFDKGSPMRRSCAASIEKSRDWRARLIKGKAWLNWSY